MPPKPGPIPSPRPTYEALADAGGASRPRPIAAVFEVEDLSVLYGGFRAVRDVDHEVHRTRSPRSSVPRAAASRRCCAASTA